MKNAMDPAVKYVPYEPNEQRKPVVPVLVCGECLTKKGSVPADFIASASRSACHSCGERASKGSVLHFAVRAS